MLYEKKGLTGATLTWFFAFLIIFFIMILFMVGTNMLKANKSILGKSSIELSSNNITSDAYREMNSFLYSNMLYNGARVKALDFVRFSKNSDYKDLPILGNGLTGFFGEEKCYVICISGINAQNPIPTKGVFSKRCGQDLLLEDGKRVVCNRLIASFKNYGFSHSYLDLDGESRMHFFAGGNVE